MVNAEQQTLTVISHNLAQNLSGVSSVGEDLPGECPKRQPMIIDIIVSGGRASPAQNQRGPASLR